MCNVVGKMLVAIFLTKFFGGLSVFGGIFTILSYLVFPSSRSPSQVYALWLAIAAIGYGVIPFITVVNENSILCKITGLIDNYFYLTALFTTAVIANCMRQIFLFDQLSTSSSSSSLASSANTTTTPHPRESIKLAIQPKNYIFVWVFPLLLNILPVSTNHFGPVENGGIHLCWIKTDTNDIRRNQIGLIWMGITMYIPLILCFIFNAYVYISIWQKVKTWKNISPAISLKLGLAINRIAWYPIILFVVYIFPIIYRYGQFFGYSPPWLAIAASSVRLQGFFDAIAYGLTEGLINRWGKAFHSWCCSCCCVTDSHHPSTPSHDTSSSIPFPSNTSHDSSSIIFSEGYLWDRLVPDVPASNHSSSSISESVYYTPLTSKEITIPSRDRRYLFNPLDDLNSPYQYPSR